MTLAAKPPVAAATIPAEWTDIAREIVRRDGYAVRGRGDEPTIEVKSLTSNRWCLLGLPGGGTAFASFEDRNLVLNLIR